MAGTKTIFCRTSNFPTADDPSPAAVTQRPATLEVAAERRTPSWSGMNGRPSLRPLYIAHTMFANTKYSINRVDFQGYTLVRDLRQGTRDMIGHAATGGGFNAGRSRIQAGARMPGMLQTRAHAQ